jgi:hypothetical protein
LNKPLELDERLLYTLRLDSFNGWQSAININDTNNAFAYSYDNGTNFVRITLPRGLYSIDQINLYMRSVMKVNNHYDSVNNKYYALIAVDENQNRCFINLTNNYQFDFSLSNINLMFGFEKQIYTTQNDNLFSPNIGKMSESLQMLVYCDLVEPNIFIDSEGNLKTLQYIATHPLFLTEPNSRLTINKSNPPKFRLLKSSYNTDTFTIKLLNENLKPLDFNGETSILHLVFESS